MERPIKKGMAAYIPIITERKVKFRNAQGDLCQSTPKYINEIVYKDGGLYVTFTTARTVYSALPVELEKKPQIPDGTRWAPGELIDAGGEPDVIKGIYGITENGIIIYSEKGKRLIGDLEVKNGTKPRKK